MTASVTQELRDAVEAEAARTGRSISQVAELWLEDARRGRASAEAVLGGEDVAPVLRRMARVAAQIGGSVGRPSESYQARAVLLKAWTEVANAMLPQPRDNEGDRLFGEQLAAERRLVERGWPDFSTDISNRVWAEYQDRFGGLHDVKQLPQDVHAKDVLGELYMEAEPGLYADLLSYYTAEAELQRQMEAERLRQEALSDKIVQQARAALSVD